MGALGALAQPHAARGIERLRCFRREFDEVIGHAREIDDVVRDSRQGAPFVCSKADLLDDAWLVAEEGVHVGPRENDANRTRDDLGRERGESFLRPYEALHAEGAARVLRDDADALRGDREERRQSHLHAINMLRGSIERERISLPQRKDRGGLHRIVMARRLRIDGLDPLLGEREVLVRISLGELRLEEEVAGVLRRESRSVEL